MNGVHAELAVAELVLVDVVHQQLAALHTLLQLRPAFQAARCAADTRVGLVASSIAIAAVEAW
jgi:hypothetical protein